MSSGGRGKGVTFSPVGKGRGSSPGKGKGGGKSGRATSSSNNPSPALLTANLKNARDLHSLFAIVADHHRAFNAIHLSAAWTNLSRLAPAAQPSWRDTHAPSLGCLLETSGRVVASGSNLRARELANVAHGVAKSMCGPVASGLLDKLACTIEQHAASCNAQELANVAYAYAKAEHGAPSLFAAIAAAAGPRVSEFNAQELSIAVHAFAKAGHAAPVLFDSLATACTARLDDFTPQGIANTVWAYAAAAHPSPALFDAVARASVPRVRDFNPQDLSITVHAFAKAGHASPALFDAVASTAVQRLGSFTPQGLANVLWAYATMGHSVPALFDEAAVVSMRRLDEFDPQALANVAWSCAKACHSDERLFGALGRAAEHHVDAFNAQDLVNTAWAFAKLGIPGGSLLAALALSMRRTSLDELSAAHLARIAWSFSKSGEQDAQLFEALARSAEKRLGAFDAADLANLAWAFANAGQLDASLFDSFALAAEQKLGDFSDEELENLHWAFARAGKAEVARLLKRRRARATAAANGLTDASRHHLVDVSRCGVIVVAGGGIGGAAAAVALQKRGFDVVVLEADRSFDARKQGYGLTIQRQDATQALGINLAQDDAPSTSHYTFSAEGHILGFFGEAFGGQSHVARRKDAAGRFVHIPRQMLRSRIVEQIRPGTIRWGAKLQSFTNEGQGRGAGDLASGRRRVIVKLKDGDTIDAALLVGSDGIFSTVRRQLRLPGDRLHFVGLIVVLGIIEDATIPSSRALTARRIFETVDGATRIYAMPFTTSSTMWQLSFPCGEEAALALSKDAAALKAEIVRRCADWHEPIPALLGATPLDGMSGYPVYDRDLLEPEVLRPGASSGRRVTLIGDAAHPMTPFRAQGANQALSDAVLLADTLAAGVARHGPEAGIDAALPEFERKMLARSARSVVGSREKATELHSRLALQPGRKVQRDVGFDMPSVIRDLRSAAIGAHSAADPRGLDAVVAGVMGKRDGASAAPGLEPSSGRTEEPPPAKRPRGGEKGGDGEDGAPPRDLGFRWRHVMCKLLDAAAGAGIRRKLLRRQVLRRFLRHLRHAGARDELAWCETHPRELQALFKSQLDAARRGGRVVAEGRMMYVVKKS